MPADWHDPATIMWGFHVHQDLTAATADLLPTALALQHDALTWLNANGSKVDVLAAFRPGYGPHKSFAWELRVERLAPVQAVFPAYGKALLWLLLNHGPHESGYVHPTMHDEQLPGLEQLSQEASHHKFHTVVLGSKPIDLNLDFFLNPALTPEGQILNTRDVNEIPREQIDSTAALGQRLCAALLEPSEHVKSITMVITDAVHGVLAAAAVEYVTGVVSAAKSSALVSVESGPDGASTVVTLTAGRGGCTFDDLAAAFGHLSAWLLVNRAPSPPERPAFTEPAKANISGRVRLQDTDVEAALGEGSLDFKFGAL